MNETKFALTEDKNWQRSLKVDAPSSRVEGKVDKFLAEYRAAANIPGFRKGKTPLSVIRQKYLEAARQDALAETVDELYREFLEKEKEIFPITRPTVSELNYEPASGLTFTANFEVRPQVELKKYKGLKLTRFLRKVKDEEVEQVIEKLRDQVGEWSSVNREAKEGDLLILDLEVTSDPQNRMKDKKIPNYEIILTPTLLPEFKTALTGIRPFGQTEVTITYPVDYSEKNLAGATVGFNVVVKEIKEKILPPKDDTLAQRLKDWNCQTYLELVLEIRKRLEAAIAQEADDALRQQTRNLVVEENPLELPASIAASIKSRLREDAKKEKTEISEADLEQKVWPPFERMAKWDFLLHELAEKEKIETTEADSAAWMARFAANYGMKPEEADEYIKKSGRIKNIRETILEEKVVDFLLQTAVIQNENEK